MQSLFDEVAEDNPQKAIELLLKIIEFVLPKMKSTELNVSREIEPITEFRVVDTGVPLASNEKEIVT